MPHTLPNKQDQSDVLVLACDCCRCAILTNAGIRAAELTAQSLGRGDHDQLADLMNESNALLRTLHSDIADDGSYEQLRAFGASAAKPCGAGGHGAVWGDSGRLRGTTGVRLGRRDSGMVSVANRLPTAPNALGARLTGLDDSAADAQRS